MASRLNFNTGGIVNPLEGLQSAMASVGSTFDKYMQREQDREDRLAREAREERRLNEQLARYDRQEAESLRRYEEGKQDTLAARAEDKRRWQAREDRDVQEFDRRKELHDKTMNEYARKQAQQEAADKLRGGFGAYAEEAAVRLPEYKMLREQAYGQLAKDYTGDIARQDTATFGVPVKDEYAIDFAQLVGRDGKAADAGVEKAVLASALENVDRSKLVDAMGAQATAAGMSEDEIGKMLAARGLGVDYASIAAAKNKEAGDVARAAMRNAGGGLTVGEDGNVRVSAGSKKAEGRSLIPGPGEAPIGTEDGWIKDSAMKSLMDAKAAYEKSTGSDLTPGQEKFLLEALVGAGTLVTKDRDGKQPVYELKGKVDEGTFSTILKEYVPPAQGEAAGPVDVYTRAYQALSTTPERLQAAAWQGATGRVLREAGEGRGAESVKDFYGNGRLGQVASSNAYSAPVQELDPVTKRAQEIAAEKKAESERQKQLELYQKTAEVLGIDEKGVASPRGLEIAEQSLTDTDRSTVKGLVAKGLPFEKAVTAVAVAKVTGDNGRIDKILNAGPISAFDRGESGLNPREAALAWWKQEPAYIQYYRDALPVITDTLSRIGNAAGRVYDKHNVFQYSRPSPEELKQYKDRLELEAKAKELAERLPQ